MTVVRGRVVTSDADIPDAVVRVDGGRVVAVEPAGGEPADQVVLPGLVDVHCHGGGGGSLTSGSPDQIRGAVEHHLRHGTTTLVGSVVTDAPDRMLSAVDALAKAVEAGTVAGIHVEGPFLDAARCGAQDPSWLREPDPEVAARLVDAGRGHVRAMTLAPELPGAEEVAAYLHSRGVVVAVGHTGADAGRTARFLAAEGSNHVTHLFNGMPPFHHRNPGPVGGALAAAAQGHARVELIADGVHVADDTAVAVLAMLRSDRVVLVSDAMAAAGMPDGDYDLGPRRVTVEQGVARLRDGGAIAGGTAALLDQVRRLWHAVPASALVAAATTNPADALGLDAGRLAPGVRADLLVTDGSLRALQVMRGGEWVT